MTRFNETVGSYERSVLTAARRFDDLGVAESPVPEPPVLEATVRTLRPAEPRLDAAERDDEEEPRPRRHDGLGPLDHSACAAFSARRSSCGRAKTSRSSAAFTVSTSA